jgi:divalent metal cation (Fe/Co/Zn/Cd) transporter
MKKLLNNGFFENTKLSNEIYEKMSLVIINDDERIVNIQNIRTRGVDGGDLVYLTLLVEKNVTSSLAYEIAEKTKNKIMQNFAHVIDVNVRVKKNDL